MKKKKKNKNKNKNIEEEQRGALLEPAFATRDVAKRSLSQVNHPNNCNDISQLINSSYSPTTHSPHAYVLCRWFNRSDMLAKPPHIITATSILKMNIQYKSIHPSIHQTFSAVHPLNRKTNFPCTCHSKMLHIPSNLL